jgi:hypothetical protein
MLEFRLNQIINRNYNTTASDLRACPAIALAPMITDFVAKDGLREPRPLKPA